MILFPMSRKGYLLLNPDIVNSDEDEEKTLFDTSNTGDGWTDGEQTLNVFASSATENGSSQNMDAVELRSRSSYNLVNKLSTDEALEAPSVRPKYGNGNNTGNNNTVLLERRVRKDDTLQKICLQFGISIAELKRVNGFIADTDLFARDIVKIPVRKHSYNHALIMAELDGEGSTAESDTKNVELANVSPTSSPTVSSGVSNDPARAERLLQNVDANILKAQRQLEQRQQANDFNSDDQMIDLRHSRGSGRNVQLENRRWTKRYIRNWIGLILVIFLLVGIPIIYIVYKLAENESPVGDSSRGRNHS